MTFLRRFFQLLVFLLFAYLGSGSVWALSSDWQQIQFPSYEQEIKLEAQYIANTARAPPLDRQNVAITGTHFVGMGDVRALGGAGTHWTSLNFSSEFNATNRGFGSDAFVEVLRQNIGARADDFTDGVYQTVRTTEETVIYRAFGGEARLLKEAS